MKVGNHFNFLILPGVVLVYGFLNKKLLMIIYWFSGSNIVRSTNFGTFGHGIPS